MGRRIRRFVMLLLGLVFLGSSAMVGHQLYQNHLGAQAYAQAEELAGLTGLQAEKPALLEEPAVPLKELPETDEPARPAAAKTAEEESLPEMEKVPEEPVWVDPYADALAAMDFTALREVNSEVRGWILIPGTNVSYPLMQGATNDKYLNRNWRGNWSGVGSIFIECQNSGDLTDFHTIIYGHRMINKSMFGSLSNYKKQSYWEKNPYVYLTNDEGCKTYAIFAAYEVGVKELTYRVAFDTDSEKQEFLDFCTAQSVIETAVTPTVEDQIITLSTCTGHGHETRWVVQAVEITV